MNRTDKLSETFGLVCEVPIYSKDPIEREKTDRDRLCELIFVPNPLTGLPSSDIGMYMNPSTPPQVRDYIQQNIFGEGNSKCMSSDVDDDTIMFMTRQSNETVDEYVCRVNQFMLAQKKSVQDSMIAEYAAQRRSYLENK